MKKLVFLGLFLFSLNCFAQDVIEVSPNKWSFITDTSAFDSVSRVAFIIGTSNDYRLRSPILAVNRTDNEPIQVHLVYWPADMAGNTILSIKFDNPTIYQLRVKYTFEPPRYTVIFDETLSLFQFVNKLQSNKMIYVRLTNSFMRVDTKFSLNGSAEAIMKLNE